MGKFETDTWTREVNEPKWRPLTAREAGLLYLKGTPDKQDIQELVNARDVCRPMPSTVTSNTYYSPEADQFGDSRHTTVMTSTNLLDHLLKSAEPAQRRELSTYGISLAATQYNEHASDSSSRISDFSHTQRDIQNKLIIFAKNGGDMNVGVLATNDPALVNRNIGIALLYNPDSISAKAMSHAIKTVGQSFFADATSLKTLNPMKDDKIYHTMRLGLTLNTDVQISTKAKHAPGSLRTADTLALTLATDALYGFFDERLATGKDKINEPELFYAAAFSKDPAAAVKKLKDLGMDINSRDDQGRTALTRMMTNISPTDVTIGDKGLSDYKATIQLYTDAGASTKIKDNKGLNAEDYYRQGIDKGQERVMGRISDEIRKELDGFKRVQSEPSPFRP